MSAALVEKRPQLLQYDIVHDLAEKDPSFIRTQLETHLKERFHVLLSTVEYGIENGHLVRQGKSEPFINSITRGRDFLRRAGTAPEDFDREDAEVEGFRDTIDPFLSDPNTPLESKVLSISLPGVKYKHNFYDIFTLKEKFGKRFVQLSRYSSALTSQEYAGFFSKDLEAAPTAADWLRNPIKIENPTVSPQQIHQFLHKEHAYMTEGDFREIWNSWVVQERISVYLLRRNSRNFNAILNCADDVWEQSEKKKRGEDYWDYNSSVPSQARILDWQNREVRQVSGGCPGKSGASEGIWSVADFDFGYEFDKSGPCKKCGENVNCGPCGICKSCDIKIRQGSVQEEA